MADLFFGCLRQQREGSAHRYYFRLYALDINTLGLRRGVGRRELLQAMNGHIQAETQCMGRFQRR